MKALGKKKLPVRKEKKIKALEGIHHRKNKLIY